jgi:hypothetical protein
MVDDRSSRAGKGGRIQRGEEKRERERGGRGRSKGDGYFTILTAHWEWAEKKAGRAGWIVINLFIAVAREERREERRKKEKTCH